MRVAVVFNPVTGGDPGRPQARHPGGPGRAGLEVLWLETTKEDPGQGLTARAVAEGVGLVAAHGVTAQ
jgi:hypothetical protein